MIELKIIESPDQEIIGNYISQRQEINIGRSYQNDLTATLKVKSWVGQTRVG